MKISIKTKLLFTGISLVVLTTIGLSSTYYRQTRQDKRRESKQRIQIAFDIILDDFVNRATTYTERFQEFLQEDTSLSITASSYLKDKDRIRSISFITNYLMPAADKLKQFGKVLLIDSLALYTQDNRLLVVYQQQSGEKDMLGAYVCLQTGEDTYVPVDDPLHRLRMSAGDFPLTYAPLPPEVTAFYAGDIPNTISVIPVTRGRKFGIRIRAPIYQNNEKIGVLVGDIFYTQPTIERYASLSKTEVNFFADDQLSIGTFDPQTVLMPTTRGRDVSCERLFTQHEEIDITPVVIQNKDYYEGRCVFQETTEGVGTLTVSLSQEIERQAIQKSLTAVLSVSMLAIAAAFSIISILVQVLFAKPIEKLIADMGEVERGNLDIQIPLRTDDEIGKLTRAFHHMKIQLKNSFQRHEHLVTELKEKNESLSREIAERERAEKKLLEERNLLLTLIDVLPDQIYVKDRQSRYLLVNKTSMHGLGVKTREEIVGKTDFDFFPSAMAEKFYADEQVLFKSGQSVINRELESLERGVEPVWLLVTQAPFRDSQGNIAGFVGLNRDITERKQSEEELRKHRDHLEELVQDRTAELMDANNQLQQEITERKRVETQLKQVLTQQKVILENVGLGIALLRNRKFEWTNPRMEELFGYSSQELAGASMKELAVSHQKYRQSLREAIPVLAAGKTYFAEHLVRRKDHSTFWCNVAGKAIAPGELVQGTIWIFEDITDRKHAEEELQWAKETAEKANRAKSEFLSSMSHELRTPLNGILGYAQILKRDRTLSPEQHKGLTIIQQSGEHLLTLINDILDITKIEAGKMEFCPTPIRFPEFLDGVVSIIHMRAQEQGIRLIYDVKTPLPVTIKADEKRLRQVLFNLLNNAVKFTDHGSVTFRVTASSTSRDLQSDVNTDQERHSEDSVPDYKRIRFEVEDTGIGISPEQVEKIFSPFEQVGDVRRRTEGAGLGLTISRKLVNLMGSELHVESEIDRGSLFWFEAEFPVLAVTAETALPQERIMIGYTGMRRKILIADDNQYNRSLLVNALEPLGFEIFTATDGQQALELARTNRPDLIFMDMVMPGITGHEATQAIRKIPALEQVVILSTSASVFEKHKQQAKLAGCDDFVAKPVDVNNLLALLEEYLQLEWVYEEETEAEKAKKFQAPGTITEKEDIAPPLEELQSLFDLAKIGDMRGIQTRAEAIKQLGAEFIPFANKLEYLAEYYEEKEIISLLQKKMQHSQ